MRPRALLTALWGEMLYRNAAYLMASMVVISGLGFAFWAIVARVASPDDVGIAAALVSAGLLIANFSQLGMGTSLIRYLPSSRQPADLLGSAFLVVVVAAALAAGCFVLLVRTLSPELDFLLTEPAYGIAFAFVSVVFAADLLAESSFTAARAATFVLRKSVVQSVIRFMLVAYIALIADTYMTIFWVFGLSALASVLLSGFWLHERLHYRRPRPRIEVVRDLGSYPVGAYLAQVATAVTPLVLPLIVIAALGPAPSAHFYIAYLIASSLYVIPRSTAMSLFAEGTHSTPTLDRDARRAIRLTAALVVPGSLLIVLLADLILGIFGPSYGEAAPAMRILAVASLFVSVNFIGSTMLQVTDRIFLLAGLNALTVGVVIAASVLLAEQGITWVAVGFLSGEAVGSAIYLSMWLRWRSRLKRR